MLQDLRGVEFRAEYDGGLRYFKVVGDLSGRRLWGCMLVDRAENEPFIGNEVVFTTEDILTHKEENDRMTRESPNERWYKSLTLGQTVHLLHGSIDERPYYVRCEVVDVNLVGSPAAKQLLPFELVGVWPTSDRPHRTPTGEIQCCWHAKVVRSNTNIAFDKSLCNDVGQKYTVIRPDPEFIWESPYFCRPEFSQNPASYKAIDLRDDQIPPLTDEQRSEANRIHLLALVESTLRDAHLTTVEKLKHIREHLK